MSQEQNEPHIGQQIGDGRARLGWFGCRRVLISFPALKTTLEAFSGEEEKSVSSRPLTLRGNLIIVAGIQSPRNGKDVIEAETGFADPQFAQHEMAVAREHALRLAEVFIDAYLELKANAPDFDVEEMRTSGERAYLKLIGIDADEIAEELDAELSQREDFQWSMREDRD